MNNERMEAANRMAAAAMAAAGYDVIDAYAVTAGREDLSHDGTHYWRLRPGPPGPHFSSARLLSEMDTE
jgi:hypothetical protein